MSTKKNPAHCLIQVSLPVFIALKVLLIFLGEILRCPEKASAVCPTDS